MVRRGRYPLQTEQFMKVLTSIQLNIHVIKELLLRIRHMEKENSQRKLSREASSSKEDLLMEIW